jgi:membrane-associated protein
VTPAQGIGSTLDGSGRLSQLASPPSVVSGWAPVGKDVCMYGLSHLQVDSPLSYAIAFALPALDAVVPVLPSETAIVALGVATAGSVDPRIALLIALAAAGAFVGDNLCYLIGRRFGTRIDRLFFSGTKGADRRAWAERTLDRFGARLIFVCRFIPGGRTAVTLTCGATHYRRSTFLVATAASGVIWASYAFFLGRLGGQAFEDKPWVGLLFALGIALVVSGLVELARRTPRWWRRFRNRPTP